MKNSTKFCDRLKCAKQYWKLKNKDQGNTDKFWDEYVNGKLDNLFNGVNNTGSSSTAAANCEKSGVDTANKEACKLITTKLEQIYQNSNGSVGDKLSEQIIKCLLLKEYAKKLKEKAKENGFCSIDNGLQKAFDQSKEIMQNGGTSCQTANGTNSCFECNWNDKEDYEDCPIGNGQNGKVKEEVVKLFNGNNDQTKDDGIQKTLAKFNEGNSLCEWVNCAAKRSEENNSKNKVQGTGQVSGQNDFWETKVKELWGELSEAMRGSNGEGKGNGCETLENPSDKTACNYLHAGLEQLYKNDQTTATSPSASSDADVLKNNPSFRHAMGCFLLHAYAKYMQRESVCVIEKGIQKAFDSWKNLESKAPSCNGSGKGQCVPCQWKESDYDSCSINTTGQSTGQGSKIGEKLKDIVNKDKDKKIKEMLTNINKIEKLCDGLKCIASHLNSSSSKHSTTAEKFWEKEDGAVAKLWTELSTAMTKTNGKDNANGQCNALENPSDQRTCNYLHAGFKQLYQPDNSPGTVNNGTILSKDNPSLRQTMGCILLHSYAQHMKGKAICDIEKGITQAFQNNNANCNGGNGQCVPCQWEDKAQLEKCNVRTSTNDTGTAGDKVEDIFQEDKDKNIKTMLTEINKMETLCNRLQCIASHLNSTNTQHSGKQNAKEFWKEETGEVRKLWQELADAMKKTNGKTDQNECDQMDDGTGTGGRLATDPERKACQYLTLGFNKLKTISLNGRNGILHKDPLFVQTMGCLLLKEYAKQMGKKSTCLIESGIKKAFGSWNPSNKTDCKDSSPCIECKFEDNIENCQITTNGSTKETADEKLKAVKSQITDTLTPTMGDMNKTESLCNQLQCAAGKWFHEHSKDNGGSNKKTWCEFWEKEGVKPKLQDLFEKIKSGGQDTNDVCNKFGDENPDSVERKACNHITAGLQHIKDIPPSGSGNGVVQSKDQDNQLLQRAVGCIALNMYADQIIAKSKDSCPIDESKIQDMFTKWNEKYNNNSSSSPSCNDVNNKDCFVCKRVQKSELNNCQLSVDTNLVETNQSTTCKTDANEAVKVQTQMNKFLNIEDNQSQSIAQVKDTLTSITDITKSPFCTQLQCAAKKYAKSKNGKISPWEGFWEETGEVGQLWTELSTTMTEKGTTNQNGCDQMYDNGTGTTTREATNPEKKACNYLHVGLNQLYNPPATAALTPSLLSSSGTISLKDNPLLRRTLGCLLLKEYAKKMKEKSTCVIDSGIEKAFKEWNGNITNGTCTDKEPCVPCQWKDDSIDTCKINTTGTGGTTTPTPVREKLTQVQPQITNSATNTLPKINEMSTLCEYIKCAGPKWFKNRATPNGNSGGTPTPTKNWCDFWEREGVRPELQKMFKEIEKNGTNNANNKNAPCNEFGDGNENSVERKACNHITTGLKYINDIQPNGGSGSTANPSIGQDNQLFFRTVGCLALNMYADKIRDATQNSCPIDETTINKMFDKWNEKYNNNSSSSSPCNGSNNVCFKCTRQPNFNSCELSVDSSLVDKTTNGNCTSSEEHKKVQTQMKKLLEDKSQSNSINNTMQKTFSEITKMDHNFCTQVQCAAKKWKSINDKNGQSSGVTWKNIEEDATKELTKLLEHMMQPSEQKDVDKYCKDNEDKWNKIGHKQGRTNKAACLLFAAGLKHIYTHGNGRVNGPSFGQTMGCLFLKEYAKQLIDLADKEKKYKVHPDCSVDKGINYAFSKSNAIMESTPPCNKNGNSCFECKLNDYDDCKIGTDNVKTKVESIFQDEPNKNHMEKTLENTVCPILLTDILTPFLPLAPVSIGLSAMAYYLWKYFGPLGKGGPRFRRSPADIPGPSVQEQVLDHVQQDSSHEYRLVKERKPRSAPTRTKRSGRANRRTIIEIHFEVLDECQKGDTQLNQKDFLELLVREFMGSEFMEEEQVPKEEVLMEGVPMELVPIEDVPSLGSGLMV
ncbi:SICAvar, type I [Plasmodium knowlesi strain H]|nr:SICAvar, type I [Plasmodium knowlesi strain H]